MKTNIKRVGDTTIVTMDGKLDFETQEPLRSEMANLIKRAKTDTVPRKIIFNFEHLEFVGSSGISQFVQTMKEVATQAPLKPRYCNVRSEFRRVMKAFDEEQLFEFYDNEERARKSFDQ